MTLRADMWGRMPLQRMAFMRAAHTGVEEGLRLSRAGSDGNGAVTEGPT
jgi:hypothetical protein